MPLLDGDSSADNLSHMRGMATGSAPSSASCRTEQGLLLPEVILHIFSLGHGLSSMRTHPPKKRRSIYRHIVRGGVYGGRRRDEFPVQET